MAPSIYIGPHSGFQLHGLSYRFDGARNVVFWFTLPREGQGRINLERLNKYISCFTIGQQILSVSVQGLIH